MKFFCTYVLPNGFPFLPIGTLKKSTMNIMIIKIYQLILPCSKNSDDGCLTIEEGKKSVKGSFHYPVKFYEF